ncbi:MAG TPA: DivIVA domain-containing protein [Acidimicrobiales bacterium]|nr:DivIVA domain-containing protein [Acidimicrobiales bacterium]
MDSGQPSQPILETLRTVEFRLGLKGYNVDEVDEYLEKAALEAERLQEQLRQTVERLRQAGERIVQLESEPRQAATAAVAPAAAEADLVQDDTLQRTLVMAQRFVDQTRREAEAEAAELVSTAGERARATLAQAEAEARQLVTDSQQRLRDEVTRLEGMRGQLATDVENMARHLEAERNRLRTMLSEVLKWVEENVQPAESLMALRPRGNGQARPDAARARGRTGEGDGSDTDDANGGNVAQVLDLRSPNPTGAPSDPRG